MVGQGFIVIEISRSHSDTPHSIGQLWTGDQHDAETSLPDNTLTTDRRPCPPAESEHVIAASERPQNHAFESAATGIYWIVLSLISDSYLSPSFTLLKIIFRKL
jgi:hypothetical protein